MHNGCDFREERTLDHSGLERGSGENSIHIQTTDKPQGPGGAHRVFLDSPADHDTRCSSPGCGSLARAKTMVAMGATCPLSSAMDPACRPDESKYRPKSHLHRQPLFDIFHRACRPKFAPYEKRGKHGSNEHEIASTYEDTVIDLTRLSANRPYRIDGLAELSVSVDCPHAG